MRKILRRAVGFAALVAILYLAGPLWAGWQLRQAVMHRDTAALERLVDWPLLRSNLKPRVADAIEDSASQSGTIGGVIKRTLGSVIAGPAIDTFVTPANLARVLAGRAFVLQHGPGTAKPAQPDDDAEDVDDPMPPRRLRWAFFESPTRFRVEATNPRTAPARIASILALEGWRWKLIDVQIVKK